MIISESSSNTEPDSRPPIPDSLPMPYILALDQGTTSSRSILFGRDGRAVASAQQEFPQILPSPGHVEHNPEAIWQSQLTTARRVLEQAKIAAADIAAIGITNQ